MEYTVNVQTAGNYTVRFRHATTIVGTALTGSVNCYNTGGSNYFTISVPNVYLFAGTHMLRLYWDTGGYNLDNLTFTRN